MSFRDDYIERALACAHHNVYREDNGTFRTCKCGDPKQHLDGHLGGRERLGVSWVSDGKAYAIALDFDAHDDKAAKKLSQKELDIRADLSRFGEWAVFRSKSGNGLHAYLLCDASADMASNLARHLAKWFSKRYHLHVDAFPYLPRGNGKSAPCLLLEYYGRFHTEVEIPRTGRTLEQKDISMMLDAVPVTHDSDASRSGYDMRLLTRLLQSAPWNWNKQLSAEYVSHTASKVMPKVLRIEAAAEVPAPAYNWLDTLIYDGNLCVVYGEPGGGKSTLMYRTMPENTLILSSEYPVVGARLMLLRWGGGKKAYYAEVATVQHLANLVATTDQKFIVIDALQTMVSDYDEGNLFVEWLNYHLKETGRVAWIISHTNSSHGSGVARIEGLLRLRQLADLAIHVRDHGEYRVTKNRWEFVTALDNGPQKDYTIGEGGHDEKVSTESAFPSKESATLHLAGVGSLQGQKGQEGGQECQTQAAP